MKKMTYRELIDQHKGFIYAPIGTSMLPLIREGKDTVKLVAIDRPLKKNDVVLYQRGNKFILHRIVSVKKDVFDIVGDHQYLIEKDVPRSSIIAIMEGVYREERYQSCSSFRMKCYVIKCTIVRSLRRFKAKMKQIGRKKS